MPLVRRVPKRGFHHLDKKVYSIINVGDLDCFGAGDVVTPEALKEKGLIKNLKFDVKLLGTGELKMALTVKAHKFSEAAVQKIEAQGGKAEVI